MPDDLFKPELGLPHHSGYLVDSIEATVERLVAELGAGPFILVEDVPVEDVLSLGEPARLEHNSAFGSCGGHPIELLEVSRVEPERARSRWSGPLPRLQHVGYALSRARTEAVRSGFAERGLAPYLSSRLGEMQITYHDASSSLGHDLEILDDVPAFREFFGMVLAAAEGWDGSEPLRRAEA